MIEPNTVVVGDCIKVLEELAAPQGQTGQPAWQADLIFADPPFNIGYKYDLYQDRRKYQEYYAWTEQWMAACCKVLKPTGSFWVAIGDDYAAEVRIIGRKLGLNLRNWVIWHYTFGQSTQRKFARSHTHLFYWTQAPKNFTFNDRAVRTFSDRQREYGDKRASKLGKVPDDVWSEFPRVCGTFEERESWHPCQMPETILARIVRVCSKAGDVVLDPFAGSGTTLVVAKKLCRRYLGIEISPQYVEQIQSRLAGTRSMGEIQGEREGPWPPEHIEILKATYLEGGVATDSLVKNRALLMSFTTYLAWRLQHSGFREAYSPEEVWIQLERLRKAGKLGRIRVHAEEARGDNNRPLFAKDRV